MTEPQYIQLFGELAPVRKGRIRIRARYWHRLPWVARDALPPLGVSRSLDAVGRAMLWFVPANPSQMSVFLRPIIVVPTA